MRTTIDIRDELLQRAREVAASQNRRLSDLVNDGLHQVLGRAAAPPPVDKPFRIEPFDLGSANPGIDFDDNGSIQQVLDEDARRVDGCLDLDQLR
jgi:hypothetical protein